MHENLTTVTERGQVSVPASIRKKMGLKPGAKLRWRCVSDRECLCAVEDPVPVAGALAMMGYGGTFRERRPTDEWMQELREGE